MKLRGLDEFKLKTYLEKHYSLHIKYITLVPVGEDSAAYVVYTKDKKYFAKVHKKGKESYVSLKYIQVIIDFLFRAHREYNFKDTPLPLLNKDKKLISKLNGFPVVLYEFIPGSSLKSFSKNDYKKLGLIIASLHNIPTKSFSKIYFERLNLEWEVKLIDIIRDVESSKYNLSHMFDLRSLILKNKIIYIDAIASLRKSLKYVKTKRKNFVITHTDLHVGNIMKNKTDVYIIDWDGLQISLPEKDLMWFSENLKSNKYFRTSYQETLKKSFKLDTKALRHYKIRRLVSDIVYFSELVLYKKDVRFKNHLLLIDKFSKNLKKLL